MNTKEAEAFKNRLRNYTFHLESIEELKEEINVMWYGLAGVKGKGFETIVPNTNQLIKELKRLDAGDKIETLEEQIKSHREELNKLDTMLNQINESDRELVKKKYIHNYTYHELSKKSYMAVNAIVYRIDKALEMVVYI
jgi:predicted nuclease with TOPRIM domain